MTMTYDELNLDSFKEYGKERKNNIENASATVRNTYPRNELAKRLHPDRQYMKIAKVTDMVEGTKCYRLVPNTLKGTTECAYFQAGQYLNVFLTINGMKVNRAYSISSSPRNALKDGYYEISIRYTSGGLVSAYILDNWKEGDEVEVSGPSGFFTYSPIRDASTVIGVAGGCGITPFLSMARAIVDGDEEFNMVLLYGSRDADHILYKTELEELAAKSDHIKFVNVLSDEEKEGYEHGFISSDIIKRYAPKDEPYSVFICGPQAMYEFVNEDIKKLGLLKKYIRNELFGELHNAASLEDYPGCKQQTVKITVSIRDVVKTVEGKATDSIMQILEMNGIAVPSRCRSGECGFCHSLLKSGEVYVPKHVDGRRLADFKYGYIHPCVTFALSDVEIVVPAAK